MRRYANYKKIEEDWELIKVTETGAHFITPKALFYPGCVLGVIAFFVSPVAGIITIILTIVLYFISPQSSIFISIRDMRKEIEAREGEQ